jgi:hypothetical protein
MKISLLFSAIVAVLLTACVSTSGVIPMAQGEYMVSATNSNPASAKAKLYKVGEHSCKRLKKSFQYIRDTSDASVNGIDTTTTMYFRCVDTEPVAPVKK